MRWRNTRIALAKLGKYVSKHTVFALNVFLSTLETGRWLQEHGSTLNYTVRDRNAVLEHLGTFLAPFEVLYLEFGVHEGDSMALMSELLYNPQAQLHGFDSFRGLPEDWSHEFPRGTFDLNGQMPAFDDDRVKLFPGWFSEVLPTYKPPKHTVLAVNLDADLYSSTKTVLDFLRTITQPGSFLYFDEFSDREHELKAFAEHLEETGHVYRLVTADPTLTHVLFERTA